MQISELRCVLIREAAYCIFSSWSFVKERPYLVITLIQKKQIIVFTRIYKYLHAFTSIYMHLRAFTV